MIFHYDQPEIQANWILYKYHIRDIYDEKKEMVGQSSLFKLIPI